MRWGAVMRAATITRGATGNARECEASASARARRQLRPPVDRHGDGLRDRLGLGNRDQESLGVAGHGEPGRVGWRAKERAGKAGAERRAGFEHIRRQDALDVEPEAEDLLAIFAPHTEQAAARRDLVLVTGRRKGL